MEKNMKNEKAWIQLAGIALYYLSVIALWVSKSDNTDMRIGQKDQEVTRIVESMLKECDS